MTVHLFLDTRASKGEAPLKIAICHNQKTAYIPTGVKITANQWDKKAQAVIRHKNGKDLNILLRSKLASAEREIIHLQMLGIKGDVKEIRDRILCELDPETRLKKENESLFLSRLKRYTSLQTKKQTRDLYEWTIKKLSEFDKSLSSRRFEDIDHDYLKDFVSHCQNLSINSRSILLRNIRAVFNDAIDAGITGSYPFRRFSIKAEKTRKKALSVADVKKLMSISGQEDEYRDMFLLMLYLRGINTIDLFSAKWSQVVNGRLEYRRSKTGALFSVKIEPEAWEIINRYKGETYLLSPMERYNDYRTYQQHLNKGLKHIGSRRGRCNVIVGRGLFPDLSSNWARHSWATIGVNIGISQDIISRGMGHSPGIKVTDTYIDFDYSLVDDANRKIIDALL